MLKEKLSQHIAKAIQRLYPDHTGTDIVIDYPNDASHGDYSCNIALRLSKAVQKNPREVAEEIVANLDESDIFQTVEIAGPGFINFFISLDYLVGNMRGVLSTEDAYGKNEAGKGKKVMVEFSSPNTNKPLHLGHARNNFLGMAMANLLGANGYDVAKTQIINDRGIHICKSMVAYDKWGRDTSPESVDKKGDHFVGEYYVKFAQELKDDEGLEKEASEMLKKWEAGDKDVRELWTKMNEWVYDGFDKTYELIGSHFDNVTYESDISEGGRAIVEMALKEGKAETIEGGAIAIDLSDCGLGDSETGRKVLVRSDGTTIYMTQDIQLAVQRMEGTDLNQLIYIVGNEQDYHFKVLFEVLKRFGNTWAEDLRHLSYGMVNLPSGKMKSREGTSVDLDNLVAELECLVDGEITQRKMDYEGKERTELIRTVALGALKYFILKVDSKSEMLYDPSSSIDFQGNTGPYLQYTHARIKSILRKSTVENLANVASETVFFEEPEEIALLRKVQLFPEIVQSAAAGYRIHLIATYLNELGQLFNNFYSKHRVLEAPSEDHKIARLQLISSVAQVINNGLAIMGIRAPERM
jgi:arginyl-tRNA synthetase